MIFRPVIPVSPERAADLEPSGPVDEDLLPGLVVDELGGDDLADDLALDVLAQVLHPDLVVVLGGDDDGLHPLRDAPFVLDRDLGLPVRAEVGQASCPCGPR